ncbi:MAG: hypothetical protein Q9191_003525, partial [Dirinaria sp. TL-2023a]
MHLPLISALVLAANLTQSLATAAPTYVNYTTITGYFLQDDLSTNASTFDFMATNFGLINRSYPNELNISGKKHNPTQWQRFAREVSYLNLHAPSDTEYKILYMGRHGDGLHNDAQAYYGTPAWNCYYSVRDGNGSVVWADASLSPLGISQAQAVHRFWASQLVGQRTPAPERFYTSPLTRCLQTANLTFDGLALQHPFAPEVKELFREGISGHTCDRRGSKTYIHRAFPSYIIEPGFAETDPLWEALHGETNVDQDLRSKTVLDAVFSSSSHKRETYVSITSHSGEIASLLRVLGHRVFPLNTGAVIPVLVRAQTIREIAPSMTASQPYTPICT